jgi:hypothetical protein
MKTNNDYQMFFQGYLEALTDIDGDQREFGAKVKMFNSSAKEHLIDIEKTFHYTSAITPIYSKKFRDFYSLSYILKKLIFIKFFNGAKVPHKSLKSFRDYVVFHLMDYVDFAFDDATYRLGSQKNFELLVTRGEDINTIFLIMSAKGKKLIFRFYHNKKYISDKTFDTWLKKIIKKEEKHQIKKVKKYGIREYKIHNFLYKDYDKESLLESAYEILVCSNKQSKSMKKICAQEHWKLKKLIPLYAKGLHEVYGVNLKPIEEIAHWRVIRQLFNVGYKEKYKCKKRLKDMLNAIEEYNQKFQTSKSRENYPSNNLYGYSISPELHRFLTDFENTIKTYKKDKLIVDFLKKRYNQESEQGVWKAIFQHLKALGH